MFCLGIQAYKYQWLDKLTVKHASVGICMWLLALINMFYLHAINSEYASSSYVLTRGFTAIGMSMCVLYVFKTYFNKNNDSTKWLSRTAFAAYVFQDIALYSVAKIYQPLRTQTPLINFIFVGISSVIIAFALAGVICKTPKLKEIFKVIICSDIKRTMDKATKRMQIFFTNHYNMFAGGYFVRTISASKKIRYSKDGIRKMN